MATAVTVGSARYEFVVDNNQFRQGLRQSESDSQASTQKVAQQFDRATQQINRNQQAMAQLSEQTAKKAAAEWAQAAQKIGVSFDAASKRFRDNNGKFVSEQDVTTAINRIRKVEQEMIASGNRVNQANARAGGGSGAATGRGGSFRGGLVGGFAGTAASQFGIGSVGEIISTVTESTKDATQAQLELNAQYKLSADFLSTWAQQHAKAFNSTTAAVQQALSIGATLNKNYGFTTEQIQILTERSADLAATTGRTLPDAMERVVAAMRGEAESAEKLGLTLNSDAVKGMANMTEEQRKNFESLDQVTKSQIVFQEFLRQTNDLQGEANKRSGEGIGQINRLGNSITELSSTIGQGFLPALGLVAQGLAAQAEGLTSNIKLAGQFIGVLGQIAGSGIDAAKGFLGLGAKAEDLPTQEDAQAVSAVAEQEERLNGALKIQQEARLKLQAAQHADRSKELAAERADAEIEAARRFTEEQLKLIEERKIALQVEREQRLEALEESHAAEMAAIREAQREANRAFDDQEAAIRKQKRLAEESAEERRDVAVRAIEDEEKAMMQSLDAQVIAYQKARDAEIEAVERRRDAAIDAIQEEAEATARAFQQQIELSRYARSQELDAASDRRDAALDALDAERLQQRRQLEDDQRAQQRARKSSSDSDSGEKKKAQQSKDNSAKKLAAIEKERDAALEAIEAERDARDKAGDEAIKQIDAQIDAENERHDLLMRQLDQEEKSRLAAVDAQLKALEQEEKAADFAEIDKQLQANLNQAREAQRQIKQRGGSPLEQFRAAQQVAEAEQAIREEALRREKEALKESLEAQKDTIKAEIDARRDAAEIETEAKVTALETQKDATQEATKIALEALKTQQDETKKTFDSAIANIRSKSSAERTAASESKARTAEVADFEQDTLIQRRRDEEDAYNARRAEIETAYQQERDQIETTYDHPTEGVLAKLQEQARIAKEEYDKRIVDVRAAYDDEKRAIIETYDDPEFGLFAKLAKQRQLAQEEYATRTEAINLAYNAEKEQIRQTYDDEQTGLFVRLQRARADSQESYQAQAAAAEAAFKKQREEIQETYQNTSKTGLLDQLEKSESATRESLEKQVQHWTKWKQEIVGEIDAAQKKLDTFLETIEKIDQEISITSTRKERDREEREGGGGLAFPSRAGAPSAGGGRYFPVVRGAKESSYVTSGGTHGGFPAADIFADFGTPIYAPVGGRLESFTVGLGGNAAILRGDDGRSYYFAHGHVPFRSGRIEAGSQIGQVGNTGTGGTEPHLHFAISSDLNDSFTRGSRGGSGNVNFSSDWWTTGGGEVTGGSLGDSGTFIDFLGREIRLSRKEFELSDFLGHQTGGGADLIRAIEQLGTQLGGGEFGRVAAAISSIETGHGVFMQQIGGPAVGPFQFDPGGELQNYARFLGVSTQAAGDFAKANPMHAANWALQGYLGNAIKQGQALGLRGSDLAEYASRFGQRPAAGNEIKARERFRQLYGYRYGGPIMEPTLLVGLRSGPYAVAGEGSKPEWIESAAGSTRGGNINITANGIGLDEAPREIMRRLNRASWMHKRW